MFYGWWIVVTVFFASAFGGATIWYGFTAFFDPLINEFGWSYTAISLAASLRGAEMGLMDIVVGFLLDRFGSRRIILAGSMLVGIGFLLLSRIDSLATFYLSFLVIFVGGTGISSVVFYSVVSRWFHKRLGLALGLAAAGFGAGGFAVPGVVYLLDLAGFRTAFVIIGIAAFIVGGFTSYFVRNRPEDKGYGPDGVPLQKGEHTPEHVSPHVTGLITPARDYTFKEAVSQPAFWIITYVSTVSIFSLSMITTHVMPYLQHIGYSRYTASIVAMMIPAVSIAGRLGIGWVSDLISRRVVFILLVVGQTVGVSLFLYAHLPFLLIPFVILFGVSYGGVVVLRTAVLRDYYGSTYIGSLIGFTMGVTSIGSIGGPLLAGWVFDTTSSYGPALIVSGILLLISVPLVLMMKHGQTRRKERA